MKTYSCRARAPRIGGRPARHLSEMIVSPDKPYLVKGLLLERQVSILAGPPNTGKSSVVGTILSHVSKGDALGKMRVKQSLVYYVGAEDPDGIACRTHGHFATDADKKNVEFFVHDEPIDMSSTKARNELIAEMNKTMKSAAANHLLIVFDTLNLSIGDLDENISRDMRRVIQNGQILARRTNAHVMFIHHTPTADATRLRGSSALNGNSDTILILNAADEDNTTGVLLKATKQRSVAKGDPLGFEMSVFDTGTDSDGDPSTAPIAELAPDLPIWQDDKASNRGVSGRANKRVEEVARVLLAAHTNALNQRASTVFATKEIASLVEGPFAGINMKPDSLMKAVRGALNTLVSRGVVEKIGSNGYQLAMSPTEHEDNPEDYAIAH